MTDRYPFSMPPSTPDPSSVHHHPCADSTAGSQKPHNQKYGSAIPPRPLVVLSALLLLSLAGCASTSADDYVDERDPWESMNRRIYSFNKTVDKAVMKPVAKAYDFIMPTLASRAVTNFFGNIDDLFGFGNDLLQLEFRRATSDGARVAWNTTAGVLGLMDVATPMGLDKHEQDLGLTFAHYGAGTGPYLVLPLLGPSDVRDGIGTAGRFLFFGPELYLFPKTRTRWGLTALKFVDKRAGLFRAENILKQAALDEYSFVRDAYLQRRRSLQYDGNPPLEDEEFLDDEDDEYFDEEDDALDEEDQQDDATTPAGAGAKPQEDQHGATK